MNSCHLKYFLLFLILPSFAWASGYPLEGRVFIRGTRDTLEGVNLYLLPEKLKATTDSNGRYQFQSIQNRHSKIVVNYPGFIRAEEDIELNETSTKNILLDRENTLTYETTIESKENKDTVLKTLSQKTAARMPGAGSDPIRAVQNLPGVNRSQGFTSQVIIQGSAPQDTRYTIDGHEIPLIFHFGGLSSVFNPDLTESFDYLSAGYQSNYGRAMGGVLNLNTRELKVKQTKGSAFVDTFNSGLEVESSLEDQGQFAAGARISYVGQVLKSVLKKSDDFSLSVAPSYGDIGAIYQKPLSSRLKFKLAMLGSHDALEFIANNPLGGDPSLRGNFSNKIGFFRLIPEFEWTHSERSKTKLSLALGRDFINTDIGDDYFNLKTIAATFRVENRTRLNDSWLLAYGMDHRLSWADVSFKLPVVFSEGGITNPLSTGDTKVASLTNVSSNLFGFYLNPIYKPSFTSPWTFYPGARVDYFAPIQDFMVQPRLGVRYAFNPSFAIVAAGGLYAQAPSEQQYSGSYGNPAIKSPSCWHLKLGGEKDLSEELSKGSEAYSGIFTRWFQKLVIPNTSTVYSNLGEGKSLGWENSLKYNLDPWDFWMSYTISRSTRSDPSHSSYLYKYDQTHFLTLIAGVNLKRNWRISSRFRYVTGPLDTIPTGAAGDLDHDVFIPIRGALYNERLNAFMMLDLRIDKRWIYDTWTLSLYLDIQNVLNRQNVEGIQYAYDYKTSESIKGIPILPTFGLKGEF